jgi:ribosomal protein L11 methyltransferase
MKPVEEPHEPAEAPPRYPYLHVDAPASQSEDVAFSLWELGARGIEERDAGTLQGPDEAADVTLVASFDREEDALAAKEALDSRLACRIEWVIGEAWRHAWRAYFKPTRIGARLVIRPSWEDVKPWPGEVVLTIDPGNAFGSGTHETTRLVLREVDRRIKGGERVLDLGCGSGILSVAALLLGADHATAIDVDPDAVTATQQNADLNGVGERISASDEPPDRLSDQYPLVLANIEATTLGKLAPDIIAKVAPGGTLVLSGILVRQRHEVRRAFAALPLTLVPRSGDWVALVFERPAS